MIDGRVCRIWMKEEMLFDYNGDETMEERGGSMMIWVCDAMRRCAMNAMENTVLCVVV